MSSYLLPAVRELFEQHPRAGRLSPEQVARLLWILRYVPDEGGPDARKAWDEWADAHEGLQRLQNYGPDLAFGYSALEEPREMRHPEANEASPDAA